MPATVRSLERRGGATGVIILAEGEELLEPPQPPRGKDGRPKRELAEAVGTRPQVGGGVHGPIEMATGVTPPLPRRSQHLLHQRLPGVTIGNSNRVPQPVQVGRGLCGVWEVRVHSLELV